MPNISSIVTIISLVASPIVYFVKRWHESRSEKSRASKNLHTELDDALRGLNEEISPGDLKKVKLSEQSDDYVYFMNRRLNHDFYDSLIYSGKINFLPTEIQQSVQDVFQIIKDHNFYLRKIRDIEDYEKRGDDIGPSEDIILKNQRYYEKLGKDEELLLNRIPKIKESLEKEFKIK